MVKCVRDINGRFAKGNQTRLGLSLSNESREKIKNKLSNKKTIVCIVCGKTKAICQVREDKFCGQECFGKFYSNENNWNWKGGVSQNNIYVSWSKNKRNRLKSKISAHTFKDWKKLKELFNFTCLCCNKKEPEIKLSEDHIIPLSLGGNDNIENIQPLCRSCNSKKHNKIINYLPN